MATKSFENKDSLFEYINQNSDKTFIAVHENIYDVSKFMDEVILCLVFCLNNFINFIGHA